MIFANCMFRTKIVILASLEAFLGCLGAISGPLGTILGPLGTLLGLSWGSQEAAMARRTGSAKIQGAHKPSVGGPPPLPKLLAKANSD